MNIVLIGFMCSGKSRIGQELANKLGWAHIDTDEMIVKDVGAPIADIIKKQGEPAFRAVEAKAVRLISALDKTVISTGGGVPMNSENMKAFAERGYIVWLQVSPETVLLRAGNIKSRPLIDPVNPLASIRSRMAEREKYYAQAPYQLSVEGATPAAAAEKIRQMIPHLNN